MVCSLALRLKRRRGQPEANIYSTQVKRGIVADPVDWDWDLPEVIGGKTSHPD
jgi:hypothetical protein